MSDLVASRMYPISHTKMTTSGLFIPENIESKSTASVKRKSYQAEMNNMKTYIESYAVLVVPLFSPPCVEATAPLQPSQNIKLLYLM